MSDSKQFVMNADGQVTDIFELEHGRLEREIIDLNETYHVLTNDAGETYVVKIEEKSRYYEWDLYAPNRSGTLWQSVREGYGNAIGAATLAYYGLTDAWAAAFDTAAQTASTATTSVSTPVSSSDDEAVSDADLSSGQTDLDDSVADDLHNASENLLHEAAENEGDETLEHLNGADDDGDDLTENHTNDTSFEETEVFVNEAGEIVAAQEQDDTVIVGGEVYVETHDDVYVARSGKILREYDAPDGQEYEYRTHTEGHFDLRDDGIYEVDDTASTETLLYSFSGLSSTDLQNHQVLQKSDDIVVDGLIVGMKIHDDDADDLIDNVLVALDGDDHLDAGDGDDWLFAEQGDDTAAGGQGDDNISGGDGDDVLTDSWGDDYIDAGSGDDVVLSFNGMDSITAGAGNDTVYGGRGDDTIAGGDGDDVILGDTRLAFSRGDDTISGGAGDDILQGGFGADVFVFAPTDIGADKIQRIADGSQDFELSIDRIDLTAFTDVSADNVTDFISTSVDGNAVFAKDDVSVEIIGVSETDLTVDHFLFLVV